ncbi:uncharacterized protein [Argopecten irradians]|uniref:uncharacterized protein n=1 Tax=Argopecten irradians TaxID=31199 RepID=UPI0037162452
MKSGNPNSDLIFLLVFYISVNLCGIMVLVTIFIVIITVYITESRHLIDNGHACPDLYYQSVISDGSRECKPCTPCRPGYRMKRKCTKFSDTHCDLCPRGQYASNNARRCRSCSNCDPESKYVHKCTDMDRAQCRCPRGTYRRKGNCVPCSTCQSGFYVKSSCEQARDTKCKKCPEGTFSKMENMSVCSVCSGCRQGEMLLQRCKATSNDVCGHCRPGMFRMDSTSECVPCAMCYPDENGNYSQMLIVDECRRRNPDQSRICMPTVTTFPITNMTFGAILNSHGAIDAQPIGPVGFFEGDSEGLVLFIAACVVLAVICFVLISLIVVTCYRKMLVKHQHENRNETRNLFEDYLKEQRTSTSDRIIRCNSEFVPISSTDIKWKTSTQSLERGRTRFFNEGEEHLPCSWNIGGKFPSVISFPEMLSVSTSGTLWSYQGERPLTGNKT